MKDASRCSGADRSCPWPASRTLSAMPPTSLARDPGPKSSGDAYFTGVAGMAWVVISLSTAPTFERHSGRASS
jgi:hypothetical protein